MKYDFWQRDMKHPEKATVIATYDLDADRWSGPKVASMQRLVDEVGLNLPSEAKELPFAIDGSIIWVVEEN